MRNKIMLTMATAGIMMCATSAFADSSSSQGGGVMEFSGSVINAPCSIKPDSQDIQVKLSDWTTKRLNAKGAHSDPVSVDINLIDCSFGLPVENIVPLSKVAVTFPGISGLPPGELQQGYIKNTATNPAQNVVIQLLKSDGTGVDLTKSSDNLQDGDKIQLDTSSSINTLRFSAQILATDAATTGDVSAKITYKLNYF